MEEGEKVFVADQYSQGHLDWYNFDIDLQKKALDPGDSAPDKPKRTTLSTLPTQATFNGMPNTRWCASRRAFDQIIDIPPTA